MSTAFILYLFSYLGGLVVLLDRSLCLVCVRCLMCIQTAELGVIGREDFIDVEIEVN